MYNILDDGSNMFFIKLSTIMWITYCGNVDNFKLDITFYK